MSYSDDKAQVKAAKASGDARRQRRAEREATEARRADRPVRVVVPGHPAVCICNECLAALAPEEQKP